MDKQPADDDCVNYSSNNLLWGIHVLEFLDMIKEGDVHCANIDFKWMLPFFYSWSTRSLYFKEIVDFIMKTEVLLSKQLAMRVRDFNTIFKVQKYGVGLSADNRSLITQSWVLLHVCVIFCPRRVVMLLFTYQGKDWHSFTPSVLPNIDVKAGTVDKRMVSKGMWLSQYAPKGVKSLCITSSQTVYVCEKIWLGIM